MTEEIRADSATITTSKYRKEKKKNLKTVKFQWKSQQIYCEAPHIFQPGERGKGFKTRNIGKTD